MIGAGMLAARTALPATHAPAPFGDGDVAPLDRAQAEHLGLSGSADSG
jgi:hypothetical protein